MQFSFNTLVIAENRLFKRHCTLFQNLFHKTSNRELQSFEDGLKNPYENAISIHPVKNEISMYKLHYFFVNLQLNETKK